MSDFIRCKFAGDPEDEFCSKCDGLTVAETVNTSATDCGGYEPEEVQPVVNENSPSPQEKEQDVQITTNYTPQGITRSITAESGISKEFNGQWYKFTYSEERILPEGCNVEEEIRALWEHANDVVDKQLLGVTN